MVVTSMGELLNACDAILELAEAVAQPSEVIALLSHARDSLERQVRAGRIRPIARVWCPFLDLRTARLQHQSGRWDAARETIRRVKAKLEVLHDADYLPGFIEYNLTCIYAQLSVLVGRPGIAPSPAEQVEIRVYRDRAMDELRRALGAGYAWSKILGDHDLDSRRHRPDFQDLVRDLAFPADPFAR